VLSQGNRSMYIYIPPLFHLEFRYDTVKQIGASLIPGKRIFL